MFQKTGNDSLSRNSVAKLPNCLRKKQKANKAKIIRSFLDSKSVYFACVDETVSLQRECYPNSDHCHSRSLIDNEPHLIGLL